MKLSPRSRHMGGLAGAVLALLLLTIPRVFQPLAPDEVNYYAAAARLASGGAPQGFEGEALVNSSPQLYVWVLALGVRVFGAAEAGARGAGILLGLGALWLAYYLARRLAGKRAGLIAAWLLAVTPAFCQGWTILDVDPALLTLLTLAAVLAAVRWWEKPGSKAGRVLAAATALLLWGRVTTPVLFLGVFSLWPALMCPVHDPRRQGYRWVLAGVVIFAATWAVAAGLTGLPAEGPLRYTWQELLVRVPRVGGMLGGGVAADLAAALFWFGPLIGCWLVAWQRPAIPLSQDAARPVFVLAVLWLAVAGAAGMTFGFPKYHAPAAVLLTVLAAVRLSRADWPWSRVVLAAAVGALLQFVLVGDGVLLVRFLLRSALAGNVAAQAALPGRVLPVLLGIAGAGICCWLAHRSWAPVLLGMTLGMNGAASALQATATYQTGYSYGARGTREAAAWLRTRVPADAAVLVPDDLLFYMGRSGMECAANKAWLPGRPFGTSDQPAFSAMAAGVPVNSIAQLRAWKYLAQDGGWQRYRVGTYDIRLRRETP